MKLFNRNRLVSKMLILSVIGFTASAAAVSVASADTSAASHQVHVAATSTHSVQMAWRGVGSAVPDEVLVYEANTSRLIVHAPIEADHNAGRAIDFGTGHEGQALDVKVAFVIDGRNTGWTEPVTFFVNAAGGSAGSVGPQGPKGDKGDPGKDGVANSFVRNLVTSDVTVSTGGTFTANEQLGGQISNLPAGVYLFTVTAKVAWKSGTGVHPEFFVYNGSPASDFSNNLFNVGGCSLADGNTSMDEYCTGTAQVMIAAGEQPNVYTFGYDADRGAGSYTLENLTVTATELQAAA